MISLAQGAGGAFALWTAHGAIQQFHEERDKGMGPVGAGLKIGVATIFPFVAPSAFFVTMAAQGARMAIPAALALYGRQSAVARQRSMPFSHSFQHSDMTAALQARAIQSMGGAWAGSRMGSEASLMSQKYGRG